MLINNDVQSSQAAHRQRRLAADDKLRADRASTEAVAREGAVRQAGEAPTPDEVAQFRGLMQANPNERPAETGKLSARDAQASAQGGQTPKFDGELAGLSTAERFRTLMQRAFAQVGDQGANEAGKGEQPASPPRETRTAEPERREATPNAAQSQSADAQRAAGADRQRPASGAETPAPRDGAKSASGDGSVDGKPRAGEHKRTADSGDAESAQTLARKAADGEAQVGAAARSARASGGSEDGEGLEAGMAQAGPGSTPTPMPTEMASAPTQPQAMTAAPQQAAAASANLAPALAELVQKHVRQMLVSDPRGGRGGRSREVLLRMQNDVLPGTDLWLTQTENGWQLRADVRSRDAYDTLLANQDELVQRFAEGALGKLTIEPVFHA
jgi:hypothetical protein